MDIVILAGGLGSRFFANSSKIGVSFWGIPVLKMLCLNALRVSSRVFAVVREEFKGLPKDVVQILQQNQYGTGAAAQSYLAYVEEQRDVLIIPGDAPLVDYDVIEKFKLEKGEADIILGIMPMPPGVEHYGRVFLDEIGNVCKIIEYKHHLAKTRYANTGILLISRKVVPLFNEIGLSKGGEVYITEIVELAAKLGYIIKPLVLKHEEALGFNNISEFHNVLDIAQKKWRRKALLSDAIFFDINTVYLSYDTSFELGAVIEPYTKFLPGVRVGSKGVVKIFSSLENCYVNGSVGPFANIRSGEIQDDAEVGAFVEVNRAIVGVRSKAKHLAYLGDVKIGKKVNIGAGCVICNYDGKTKQKTTIGENAFVGGNTTLIAPINIGKKSILAAGSTFNKDVEDETLSIARCYQTNKDRSNK